MDTVCLLVVDEDTALCRKLSDRFDRGTVAVIQARDTSEAIGVLLNRNVKLLVLDTASCLIPVQEIVPIYHMIDKQLPIIVTSKHNTPDLEKQVRSQKIFYYHIKSFGISDLELAVKSALEKRCANSSESKEVQ